MRNSRFTRRQLGALGAGAAAAGLAGCAPRAMTMAPPADRRFPANFAWGAASAAFQTEGSPEADGRGPSIWDVFAATPGKIIDGSNARLACDSYRRYTEDADLLAAANLKHYRFSVAWPRIHPSGSGAANDAGLDHYSRFVDALLERGVAPHATLFHWDLPQALQDKGGWTARETSERFADYAGAVARRLGDRVKSFIVLNEAAVHTVLGHVLGEHAPGLKGAANLGPVIHHLNLAQGLGIKALRAERDDLSVGTTMALQPARAEAAPLAFWNRPAADGFDALWNGAFLDPLFEGTYPAAASAIVGPSVKEGDLDITRQPIDFAGVNYYSPTTIRLDLASPSRIAPGKPPKGAPRDAFGREVDPSGLFRSVLRWRRDPR
jgi:beta-glucosidase